MAVVIYSETDGVFLGACMGLAFWSNLEALGLPAAVTFPDDVAADEYMAGWISGRPEGVRCVPVDADQDGYASIAACVHAGLPGWIDEQTTVENALPA